MNYSKPLSTKYNKVLTGTIFALVCLSMFLVLAQTAFAETLVYSKTDQTYIRSGKSFDSEKLFRVKPGISFYVENDSYTEWYTVKRSAEGIELSGYVHRDEIETSIGSSNDEVVVSLLKDKKVYPYPNESAEAMQTLPTGRLLQYAMYNKEWAWAKFDGKVGFFKLGGEQPYQAQNSNVQISALLADISIYDAPTSNANVSQTYKAGNLIQYANFNDTYNMASFNGVVKYFKKDKLAKRNPKKEGFLGLQVKEGGLSAYATPSADGKVLKSYSAGTQLTLADFNGEFYIGRISLSDGTKKNAYFKAQNLEPVSLNQDGWLIAAKAKSNLYDAVGGRVIATMTKGTIVQTENVANGWYTAPVSINGTTVNAFMSANDFRPMMGSIKVVINKTPYNISLRQAVANQLTKQAGNKYWVGNNFVDAPSSQVMYHMDPSNFPEGSTSFFQFLRLDKSTGVSSGAMNQQLKGMGVLEGQGQAFREAADLYRVNEVYLMSHAIHETGKGTSNLAKGVYFNPKTNQVSYTSFPGAVKVYNVYGIGAKDSNALFGGAEKAYKEGWTSVAKAVVGGAKFVAQNYVMPRDVTMSGQNTLYKMLWHPEYNARYNKAPWHEYATDISWANTQTLYLAQFFADYSSYTLTFDVPEYR
ncbi:MAG: glucosaminidase domain-containing protein [Coriobacteriia bacterium]|nr:glucosaminidase domain-containing protein [Coriobacteriia bacterium]